MRKHADGRNGRERLGTGRRRWSAAVAVVAVVAASVPVAARVIGRDVVEAAPASATDEHAIPHYFGPYPNWANSPQVLPNALVTIEGPKALLQAAGRVDAVTMVAVGAGYVSPVATVGVPDLPGGVRATATASVDGLGRVTVTLVGGGSGYTSAPTITITESAAGVTPSSVASARATIRVDALTVLAGAAGYSSPPTVTITESAPGGHGTGATGAVTTLDVNGAVTAVSVTATGGGYTSPVVAVAASPRAAEANATVNPVDGSIDEITVTDPGSGYAAPPVISITAPGAHQEPFETATATAQFSDGAIRSVTVDLYGFGYTAPVVSFSPDRGTTAVVSGVVDDLSIVSGGSGYKTQPILEFSLPELPGGTRARGTAVMNAEGVVIGVDVVDGGSGYRTAPTVRVLDGEVENPSGAVITATIAVNEVVLTHIGSGYATAPVVTISDSQGGTGTGAFATATVSQLGAITGINVTDPGKGYLTPGLRKFVDTLAGLGETGVNNLGNYLPVAEPDTTTYPGTDYYEIGVVQYRHQFHSSLPPTLVRGYVQLSTSVVPGQHVALSNANIDPEVAATPVLLNGEQVYGVDSPHYLGPTILATKNRPTRILFRNLLPTGSGGDLFLPVDTTLMGAGSGPGQDGEPVVGSMMIDENGIPMPMGDDQGSVLDSVRNPICGNSPKPAGCYTENRAELHLHGGVTPWISDGTPHQWVTPANENTIYPKGVSVSNVPDMADPGPGAMTFFYTNQQSARLMFYHDHAWGITRLNVYAGEAAPYMITDATEQSLFGPGAPFADLSTGTPLVVQDKTFVPTDDVMALQDPTWNASRWGGLGSLWTPHVYMPAQNPGDATGMSGFGRWMYGPWFWPPATSTLYDPIDNPYYDPNCDPDVAAFCEPAQIPGTPNISVGMEAFNDTPIVNGTAYPTTTLDPKAYRFRVLNAANDRFFNLSWYVADPTTGTLTEVALNPAEVAAAQTDPTVFPTPDRSKSPAGPSWIQIGTEGGFLPAPVVVPAQHTTWITDPTRFDVGNVDQHSLLLAPAERADVIVDFSQFRGKTLILYNDAPAAFPARVPGYDYYTGGPDLSPSGAPTTLPGYGPNTRTVMQVKVSSKAPAVAFDRPGTTDDRLGTLMNMFAHQVDGSGVFEDGQHAPIVGQAAYNSALGTDFVGTGWCNSPSNPSASCDGFARIAEQGGDQFKFDTVDPDVQATTTVGTVPDGLEVSQFDGQPGSPSTLSVAASTTGFGETGRLTVETQDGDAVLSYTGLQVVKTLTGLLKERSTVTSVTFTGVRRVSGEGAIDTGALVRGPQGQLAVPIEPKGMHDEMNSATFDEFGRMTANLGLEAPGATPLTQNIILYTYASPATEVLRSADFPTTVDVQPISSAADGTQIWKITHNGVDTHPIHFHLYDVQVVNRVTWDNIVIPPEPTELGWKDTVRVSPLEDTIVAVRPIIPVLPFAIPDSRRPLNPMMPLGARGERAGALGSQAGFNNTDVRGVAIAPIVNAVVNFGWEYVFHCHILNHEEMDMMRPMNVEVTWLTPSTPTDAAAAAVDDGIRITWGDPTPMTLTGGQVDLAAADAVMKRAEIGFRIDRRQVGGDTWVEVDRALANGTEFVDGTGTPGVEYDYRVVSWNEAGESASAIVSATAPALAPSALTASVQSSPLGVRLDWVAPDDPTATAIVVERAVGDGAFSTLVTLPATGDPATLPTSTVDESASPSVLYRYRVRTDGPSGLSGAAGPVSMMIDSTTTAVTASVPSAAFGTSVTFTAQVTPARPATVATGSVTFHLGDSDVVAALDETGAATATTSALAAGTHTITATYGGAPDGAPVTLQASTGSMSFTVGRATSAVALGSTTVSTYGASVTFTATVTPSSATGTVTFALDQGTPAATTRQATVVSGVATYTTSTLTIGTHSVSASYSGDGSYLSSTASAVTQTVTGVATTTTLQADVNPAARTAAVTFTADVEETISGAAVDSGSVTFQVVTATGGVITSVVSVDPSGRATWTTSALPAGSNAVTASFGATVPWLGSTATLSQVVLRTPTTVQLALSRPTSIYGQAVTIRGTVNSASATGTVTFVVDNARRIIAAVGAGGVASVSVTNLPAGRHSIVAVYSGDASFAAAASTATVYTVTKSASTTRVVTNRNPSPRGAMVVFTVDVTAVRPGAGVPVGVVRIVIDGWLVRDLPLNSAGRASYATVGLARGYHTVTVQYRGSPNHLPSSATLLPRQRIT